MTVFGDDERPVRANITVETTMPRDHGPFLDALTKYLSAGSVQIDHDGTAWAVTESDTKVDQATVAFSYRRVPEGLPARVRAARTAFRGNTIEDALQKELYEKHEYHAVTVEIQKPGFRYGIVRTPLVKPDVLDAAAEFFGYASQTVRAHGGSDSSAILRYGQLTLMNLNHL